MDDINKLERELEELRSLRDRLISVDEAEELNEYSADIRVYLKDELKTIDNELRIIEKSSKELVEDYEKIVKRLQTELEENEKKLENTMLYSDEEIMELREKTERQKLELNEKSVKNQRTYEEIKRLKRALKKQKTDIETRIKESEALGLTYNEYKDIYSTLRSRKIMDKILKEKGLSNIIYKKANERTPEEKEILKKTKNEILKEISEFRKDKEYSDYSVLDIIEALYSLDNQYIKVETPRETQIKNTELMVINENKKLIPHKVANPYIELNSIINNLPEKEEAPKDMEGAKENEKVDINELKPAEEKVTLFKDIDSNDYYVRKYTVDRFKLKSADLGNEVRINGSLCYKISDSDVKKIKENANNNFSPYIADIKEIDLKAEKAPSMDLPPIEEDKDNLTNEDIKEVLDENVKEDKLEATNIKVNEKFKEELKTESVVYKIVRVVPKIIKIATNKFKDIFDEKEGHTYDEENEERLKRYIEQDYVYEAMLEDKLIEEEKRKAR